MLCDTLSRAPHASVNVLEVLKMDFDEMLSAYEDAKFYGAVLKRIKGEDVLDEMVRKKIDKYLPFFLYEDGKLCIKEDYGCQGKQFLQ